ncbi:MAG: helix-turn-helix domain-containing protein [Candidatus Limnocylindrales bacterium]
MKPTVNTEYCSFTKAVEYLGDRWSLLILRELAMAQRPLGFNALARAIPGHISRSVLTERLHKLRDLGLVVRDGGDSRQAPYQLTGSGEALIPAMLAFRDWADGWLPDDPAMVERDPEIILGWLTDQVEVRRLPERQAIIELALRHERVHRSWLVLEKGAQAYGCMEDPELDESRYVYVEAGAVVLMAIARGQHGWSEAIEDGSVEVFGDPDLVAALPTWFARHGSKSRTDRSARPRVETQLTAASR